MLLRAETRRWGNALLFPGQRNVQEGIERSKQREADTTAMQRLAIALDFRLSLILAGDPDTRNKPWFVEADGRSSHTPATTALTQALLS